MRKTTGRIAMGITAAATVVGAQSGTLGNIAQHNKVLVSHHRKKNSTNKGTNTNSEDNDSQFAGELGTLSKMTTKELTSIGVKKTVEVINGSTVKKSIYKVVNKEKYLNFIKEQAIHPGSFMVVPNSQTVTMGNMVAEIGNINVTPMSGEPSITGAESYTPTATTDLDAGIINPSTVINYSIPITVKTLDGKTKPIAKAWITGNPTSTAINSNKNAEDITADGTANQNDSADFNASTSFNPLSGESTGNMVLDGSLTFGTGDWKQVLNPNLEIHFLVNGKEYTENLNVPTYKIATNYNHTYNFNFRGINTSTNANPKDTSYQIISSINTDSLNGGVGEEYNSSSLNNFAPTSYEIKLNNANTSEFNYTPCKGVTYNPSTETYTVVPSELATDGALFNVTVKKYNSNGMTDSPTISVVKMNVPNNYDGVQNLNYTNTYDKTWNSNININIAGSGTFNIIPNMAVSSNQKMDIGNSLNISQGAPFNGTVYDATILNDGLVAVSANGQLADDIKSGQLYGYTTNTSPTNSEIPGIIENTKFYTATQIESMVKAGDKLPLFNVILKTANYSTTKPLEINYGFQPVSGKNNGTAIQYDYIKFDKSITNGSAQYNMLAQGLSQYDSLINDGNDVTGLIIGGGAGSQNSYTDTNYAEASQNNYISRFGNSNTISGVSLEPEALQELNSFTISNGTGTFSSTDGTDIADFKWANQVNTYNLSAFRLGRNETEPIVFNMGHKFTLDGEPTISGVPVTYKIEGNKILFYPTAAQINEINQGVTIEFSANYNGINSTTTLNPTLITPSYNINQQFNGNDITNNSTFENTVQSATSTDQIQVNINEQTYATDRIALNNSGKTAVTGTMTAEMTNLNPNKRNYSVIASVPNKNTSMTPGSFSDSKQLSANSMTINGGTVGAIYVLPKSALNAKNEAILKSTDPNSIPANMKYIESPGSGWVKVSSLNNTSNDAAVAYGVTVQPGQSSTLTMNLNGTRNKKALSSYYGSQYKYYSNTSQSGAMSNISKTVLTNPKLSNGYVPGNNSTSTPAKIPFSLTTYNASGKVVKINDLTSTGITNYNSQDGSTQTQYSGDFNTGIQTLLQPKELNSLGYKLTGVTINGVNYTAAQFRNMAKNPLFNNFNGTYANVIAHVEKVKPIPKQHYKVTISVVNDNGAVLVPATTVTTNGTMGEKINYKSLNNPLINQYLSPNPDTDGPYEGTSINGQSGYVNANQQNELSKYLKAKGITASENAAVGGPNYQVAYLPNKVTGNMNIVITIASPMDPSLYENNVFLNSKGEIITPKIAQDQNLPQLTFNSGAWESGQDMPTSYTKLGFQQPASVDPGSEIPVLGNEVFPGYHIVKEVTQQGNLSNEAANPINMNLQQNYYNPQLPNIAEVSATGMVKGPSTITENNVYSKMPNESTTETWYWAPDDVQENLNQEIVTTTGKVIEAPTSIYKAGSNSPIVIQNANIPAGYHLVKMELNGKTITSLPSDMPSNGGTIKYVVAPDAGNITTEVMGPDNKVITSTINKQSGNVGSPYKIVSEKIPTGYQISSVTVNGKTVPVKDLSSLTIGNNPQTVVYHISKIPDNTITETVNIVNSAGKVTKVIEPVTTINTGYEGETVTVKPGTNPNKDLY
ncbi:MAG: hypothetical protein ACRDD2_13210, partial [Sarcina sp.]